MLAKKTMAAMMRSFPQMGTTGIFLCHFLAIFKNSVSGTFSSRSCIGIKTKRNLGSQSGQVVLEYALLIAVALIISLVVLRNLVGSADAPAGFRKAWIDLLQVIAKDTPDG